jgi:hypothetical protein
MADNVPHGRQFRICRKVASVPVTAGGFITVDLPRTYDYESIFFRINGTIQVTTGATSVRAEAPCQVVPRIEVIADGKNTLFSAPFWYAALGKYDRPLPESGARAVTPPTAAAIASYVVEAIGVVDFMTVDGQRPKDSNFRSSGLQLFQARLTFGNAIDSFVPGAGVAVFVNMFVDVYTQEMIELPDSNGDFTSPSMLKKVSYQQIALAASNTNQQILLPAGNLIKSVLLRGEGNATAGEPSALTYNNIQALSGVDVRVNLTGPQLRAKNNADYGQLTTGYFVVDFTSRGEGDINLTEMWDVTGNSQPQIVADVVGGANINTQLVVTEYIPLAQG